MTINQNGQEVTEWLELGNGCICCSVKYLSLHPAITNWVKRKRF